ncbi:MAG: DUF962 domain-containing protein [Candidatus Eremiobacteraeota bacterium]|nr:DUF962 domain-containing protein [Candidatus Eremiobacteraeota bacterium]MBV8434609.1 DUF962 domain-containing protein [Candidatus Eremiobacteraeota bacterium]MBV8582917.1 DUF962 domain-containing protein [Candidatus Eremiobacteraeota bacterium]MBV8722011.1 DUF962 domain-containing protein [Candidatus Eremiobacteraeota bacterium]
MSFQEFWPRYLLAHSDPRTRACHVAGTIAATALMAAAVATRKPALAAVALVAGYGPAWISHAFIEHNKPETFRAPFSSLAADYVMAWHVLRGTIAEQYAAIGERA